MLAAHGHDVGAPDRHRHLVAGAVPDLDQRRRIAQELVAGGRQLRARLVPDEQLPVELIFQHPHSGADRGLGDVEVGRGADEAARLHDFEEGSCGGDVH